MTQSAMDMVKAAKANIRNLSLEEARAARDGGALVVDLREPGERTASGVIPGAIHVPRGMLEFHADPATPYYKPEFTPDRQILLHCASGGRSALAADVLQRMGYTNVAHIEGGYKAWSEAGLPTGQA